LRWKKMM